jgi:hypothetical protein
VRRRYVEMKRRSDVVAEVLADLVGDAVFLGLDERLQNAADTYVDVFFQNLASQVHLGVC